MEPARYPITQMLHRCDAAVECFPKAALFELRQRGYTSLFEQLLACVVSIRTLDETTLLVSQQLFAIARTPADLKALPRETLISLLEGTTFPAQKADTIYAIADAALAGGGTLKADFEALTAIKGVGPKCANLALGIAAGVPAIAVDIHVHRVVNRWGLVATSTPEKTLKSLEAIVPKNEWIEVNRVLMPFGKFICTGSLPKCSTCPVAQWCRRIGVTKHL